MQKLESRGQSQAPHKIDVTAVDAVFILKCQVDLPDTFGDLSRIILRQILLSKHVDFVCDTYDEHPYIKDVEHAQRGSIVSDIQYNISGPEQKRPYNFQAKLQLPNFKRAILNSLAHDWQRANHTYILEGHELFICLDDHTWLYKVQDSEVIRETGPQLMCNHKEADTRLIFHAKHVSDTQPDSNLVVRCSPQLCNTLPGCNAFTGNDYTATFFNKGKVRPLGIMEKYLHSGLC